MNNYLDAKPIGSLQRKMLQIIKQEKQIPIIEIGKRVGKYPKSMANVHGGLGQLEMRGIIEIKLPEGYKRNKKYAVFVKDYVEPKLKKDQQLTIYEFKERQMRRIIKGLQTIKKDEELLRKFERSMLMKRAGFDIIEGVINKCLSEEISKC